MAEQATTPKESIVKETFEPKEGGVKIVIEIKVSGDAPLDDFKAHMSSFADQIDLTLRDHLDATQPRQRGFDGNLHPVYSGALSE